MVPSADSSLLDRPCSVLDPLPCRRGDARNLLMARRRCWCGHRWPVGTISEVRLEWLHHRPLLPLAGCGGRSVQRGRIPPDERGNAKILPWAQILSGIYGHGAWLDGHRLGLAAIPRYREAGQP